MSTRTELITAKSIRIYKNGDPFYPGRKFVVNEKQIRNYDSFLTQVTTGIRANAAIRSIYTPINGHRVDRLDTLENGKPYVAGGVERFKKLGYSEIGTKKPNARTQLVEIKPVQHSLYKDKVAARWREWIAQPCAIHVYRNGDFLNHPVKMLLPQKALHNWDMVLDMVTDRVNLTTGAVRRLYSIDGRQIVDLADIKNGETFVAVGPGKFKRVPYGQGYQSPVNSPRSVRTLPPINRPRQPAHPRTQTQPARTQPLSNRQYSKKQKDHNSPKGGYNNHKKKRTSKKAEETEGVFHSKPTIVKHSKERDGDQIKYEDDPNSVFKAKNEREETRGASEVKEDKNTAVELPIDQVTAEEVLEEDIKPEGDELELPSNEAKEAEDQNENQPSSPPRSPAKSPVASPPSSPARSTVASPPRSPARSTVASPPRSPARSTVASPPRSPARSPVESSPRSPAENSTKGRSSPTNSNNNNKGSRPVSAPVSSGSKQNTPKASQDVTPSASPPKTPEKVTTPDKESEDKDNDKPVEEEVVDEPAEEIDEPAEEIDEPTEEIDKPTEETDKPAEEADQPIKEELAAEEETVEPVKDDDEQPMENAETDKSAEEKVDDI
ncbi:doublecortin domain-containing protein 2-like [Saccoglossus kowalevskii]|uniref:Doublecortin domain-containing protein 2-like n=1 Tax=Saccoglossus kowalevskii TaxID=10224 RepID=A0ABM0GMU0_SACKO|nr:PREDICTED: doublecortin domain-containing protein 2-like [Saccoglossus kowalevskii]